MYKNFKLSDEERKQIMEMHQSHGYKKPLNENMMGNEQPAEETPAAKVEDVVNNSPQFNNSIDAIVGALSDEEITELQSVLSSHGISASSSAEEVHSALSQPQEDEMQQEMGENNNPKKEIRSKVANILHNIGAGNIAAWGGVPAAIAIGSMTGMPLGFAISWGATAVLMGIAKKLDPNADKMDMSEEDKASGGKELNESSGPLDGEQIMFHSRRLVRAIDELKEAAKRGNMKAIDEMKDQVKMEFRRFKMTVEELEGAIRRL